MWGLAHMHKRQRTLNMAFHCVIEVIKKLSETSPRISSLTFERNVPRVLPQKSPNTSSLESEGYFTKDTLQQSLKQSTAYTKLPMQLSKGVSL